METFGTLILHGERERTRALGMVASAPPLARITVAEPRRSDQQSARMWAHLGDILKARPIWHGIRIDKEDLKQIFLSALIKETRLVPNLDGNGFITLSHRSSRLGYREMGNLITLIEAWAAQEEIVLHDRERVAA